MPKWANVGQDLGCLDITIDYLNKELPQYSATEVNVEPRVFTDGKDWCLKSTKDSDTNTCRATFSSKNDGDATRAITFSTGSGLVFAWTRNFAARAGERELVGQMGSIGPTNADVRQWEDVKTRDPFVPKKDDKFYSALDTYINSGEYDDLLS